MDKKLVEIQTKLKVPKDQKNTFSNYSYRSCEDILEAVKPLLGDNTLTISDELVNIGDRYYVKATAKFNDVEVTAYAREEETKKGMDGAQITGSASSYARKYALNGLFLIDDTRDSDATNTHGKDVPERDVPKMIAEADGLPRLLMVWQKLTKEEQQTHLEAFTAKKESYGTAKD